MQATASVKHIGVTPQKARRVINLIRGKQAKEALAILKFSPQGATEPISKVLVAAIANARVIAEKDNSFFDESDLYITEIFVDEGVTFKRIRPRARGSADKLTKRTSHVTLTVATPDEEGEN